MLNVFIALAGLAFLVLVLVRSIGDPCGSLEAIARDAAKADYLRAWVSDRMARPDALHEIDRTNSAPKTPAFSSVGLDLAYLGLDENGAGLTVHRIESGGHNAPDNIEAVSFDEGRNAIIILTDNYDADTSRDTAIKSETTRKISDRVLVRCGFNAPD